MCKQYNQTTEECFYGDFIYFFTEENLQRTTTRNQDTTNILMADLFDQFSHIPNAEIK